MSERVERFGRITSDGESVRKAESDPVQGAFFEEYLKSLGTREQARLRSMAQRRHTGEGLSADENLEWQIHAREYSERMKSAENTLANLNDEGIQALGQHLGKTIALVNPQELPNYIRGLAARSSRKSSDPFMQVAEHVAKWKGAARDRHADHHSNVHKEQLMRLAGRYKVPDAEIQRMLDIRDDKERLRELKGAVGKSGFFKTIYDIARQPYFGTRAGALNHEIKEMILMDSGIKFELRKIVNIISKVDTTSDKMWQEIPEVMRKKQMIEQNPDSSHVALTLESSQKLTSVEAVKDRWESILGTINGGVPLTRFKELCSINASHPEDTWSESVDVGGGNTKTFKEMYENLTSVIKLNIENRGYANKFTETLRTPLVDAELAKAKTRLTKI